MAFKSSKTVILAIDTSGRTGSAAIGVADNILAENVFSAPMVHSKELFPTIQTLLEKIDKKISDLGQLYITIGPGSFTGLRIAVTMAKMMHFASGIQVVAIPTSDAIAQNATYYAQSTGEKISRVATVLDAKRKQFFIAVFESTPSGWKKVADDSLMTAGQFLEEFGGKEPVWLLGEGLVYYKDSFASAGIKVLPEQYWPVRAAAVYELGRKLAKRGNFADPIALSPIYLRRPEAIENLEKSRK